MDLEAIYRTLFEDNCEAAEPTYLEWFEYEFDPAETNWESESEALAAMQRLVDELSDVGYDRETLVADYGPNEIL